jgi:hypothetical protein
VSSSDDGYSKFALIFHRVGGGREGKEKKTEEASRFIFDISSRAHNAARMTAH